MTGGAAATQVARERARRDAQAFVFDLGVVRTKDEHDPATPVKPFPDTPELRALLDILCVGGRCLEPEAAVHAQAAGVSTAWLTYLATAGVVFLEKSRQVMATWLVCAYALWRARRAPHQLILIQSKREEDAAALVYVKEPTVARISFMESQLPPAWRMTTWPASGTYGRLFVRHPQGAVSQLWGIPEGGDIIRSNTPSLVIADEAAFQPDFGASYTAALPAIKGGGQYIALSSAEPGAFAALVAA